MVVFWSEVQVACIWFNLCHCHPIISASAKSRMVILLVPTHPGSPGQRVVNGSSSSISVVLVCKVVYAAHYQMRP